MQLTDKKRNEQHIQVNSKKFANIILKQGVKVTRNT